MPKIETPVGWVLEEYVCDACGKGKMIPTGMTLMSQPAQYPHRCDTCDAHQNFKARYPNLASKTIKDPQ